MNIDTIKLPQEYDRRRKLTDADKEEIMRRFKEEGAGIRALARAYNVNKGLISFIVNPEQRAKQIEGAKRRRAEGRYKPTREQRTLIMREHRAHKVAVLKGIGKLRENGKPVIEPNYSPLLKDALA